MNDLEARLQSKRFNGGRGISSGSARWTVGKDTVGPSNLRRRGSMLPPLFMFPSAVRSLAPRPYVCCSPGPGRTQVAIRVIQRSAVNKKRGIVDRSCPAGVIDSPKHFDQSEA